MCSLEDAPFPLQPDAFSCRDARDFNKRAVRIANEFALFHSSVDVQGLISALFALASPLPSRRTLHTLGKR